MDEQIEWKVDFFKLLLSSKKTLLFGVFQFGFDSNIKKKKKIKAYFQASSLSIKFIDKH